MARKFVPDVIIQQSSLSHYAIFDKDGNQLGGTVFSFSQAISHARKHLEECHEEDFQSMKLGFEVQLDCLAMIDDGLKILLAK